MEELKVTDKPSEIGFYSGLVVSDRSPLLFRILVCNPVQQDSSFSIAQCCTILQWGRLSVPASQKGVYQY
jgi:hypothetical protein